MREEVNSSRYNALFRSEVLGSIEMQSWSTIRLSVAGATALVLCTSLWNAWICDDAFITFRVADNFLNGFGPRWNVDERVQAYSNPFWLILFIPIYAVVASPYAAGIILGVLCTATALLLMARWASCSQAAILGMAVCMTSKAFIDYATSGLENSAAYALLAGLAGCIVSYHPSRTPPNRHLFVIALLCGLLAFNRLDGGILAAPALLWASSHVRSMRSAMAILAGLSPLVAWLIFATVYYGFPFPNTAYAKLDNGWDSVSLALQGLRYLLDSLTGDPVTLLTVAVAVVTACLRRSTLRLLFVTGAALHLGYVVKIGGDFMSGRFLTAPFFAALLTLVIERPVPYVSGIAWAARPWDSRLILLGLFGLGLINPSQPLINSAWWRTNQQVGMPFLPAIESDGICDERAFYYPSCGLARLLFCASVPKNPLIEQGKDLRAQAQSQPGSQDDRSARAYCAAGCIGYMGFYAGPQVHAFDPMALSDAFVARLPPKAPRQRIGHIERIIPAEYIRSRITNRNQFTDQDSAHLYDDIMVITTGKLFSADRWRAIVRLNSGETEWLRRN